MAEDVQETITLYVAETLRRERGITATLSPDMSLIDSGLLDSLSIVTFVGRLESAFAITITMSDMTLDNFDNVNRITELVKSKRRSGEQGGDSPQ